MYVFATALILCFLSYMWCNASIGLLVSKLATGRRKYETRNKHAQFKMKEPFQTYLQDMTASNMPWTVRNSFYFTGSIPYILSSLFAAFCLFCFVLANDYVLVNLEWKNYHGMIAPFHLHTIVKLYTDCSHFEPCVFVIQKSLPNKIMLINLPANVDIWWCHFTNITIIVSTSALNANLSLCQSRLLI